MPNSINAQVYQPKLCLFPCIGYINVATTMCPTGMSQGVPPGAQGSALVHRRVPTVRHQRANGSSAC